MEEAAKWPSDPVEQQAIVRLLEDKLFWRDDLFWKADEHVRRMDAERLHQQGLKLVRDEAFWDDLLGILRKARAFMPGPALEKTILEVKNRRQE